MFENDFHRSGQLQNLKILLMQTFYSKDINMCLNFLDKVTNIAKTLCAARPKYVT